MLRSEQDVLRTQSEGMAERYIKTVEEDLRKVVTSQQRKWNAILSIFLLAYRASTHDTTTQASLDCAAITVHSSSCECTVAQMSEALSYEGRTESHEQHFFFL
jgi:Holliday junction resolvasome RuvABC endonuclease subunit